jgi:hypothetical protein
MIQVPAGVRLLLALVIFVGVSLAFVWVFHERMLRMDDKNLVTDGKSESEETDGKSESEEVVNPAAPPPIKVPNTVYLAQRVLGLTATGFVFLLAFTLGNFWGNHTAASSAILDEGTMYARAVTIAQLIPAEQGGTQILSALEKYREDISEKQWPLLQDGNSAGAYAIQVQATGAIGKASVEAGRAGATKLPEWNLLTEAITSMTADATQRIAQLPSPNVPVILMMIGILGVTNLVLTAAFQAARRGPNLLLIGIMAGITGLLMFLVVEASNPFNGGGAVNIPILG